MNSFNKAISSFIKNISKFSCSKTSFFNSNNEKSILYSSNKVSKSNSYNFSTIINKQSSLIKDITNYNNNIKYSDTCHDRYVNKRAKENNLFKTSTKAYSRYNHLKTQIKSKEFNQIINSKEDYEIKLFKTNSFLKKNFNQSEINKLHSITKKLFSSINPKNDNNNTDNDNSNFNMDQETNQSSNYSNENINHEGNIVNSTKDINDTTDLNNDINNTVIKSKSPETLEDLNISDSSLSFKNISLTKNDKINALKALDESEIVPMSREYLLADPESPTYMEEIKKYPIALQQLNYRKYLMIKKQESDKKKAYNQRVYFSLLILLIGLFALWIPLYRVVCEHAGFLVGTSVADYKDYNKEVQYSKKFKVNFHHEVDPDLPWEFRAEQDSVWVSPGETALIFYKAKNKTPEPIVGLSVYDVHPQCCAFYFNKVQCFCFENQMLGPYEEVDLPVLFYLDPAIQEDPMVVNYRYYDLNLKYTFYFAKKQDLAHIMKKRLKEEEENEKMLNSKKKELNDKYGYEKYVISENSFNTLPGVNPALKEFKAI